MGHILRWKNVIVDITLDSYISSYHDLARISVLIIVHQKIMNNFLCKAVKYLKAKLCQKMYSKLSIDVKLRLTCLCVQE